MKIVNNDITQYCDKKGAVTYRDLTQSGRIITAYDKLDGKWIDTTELRKLEQQVELEQKKAANKEVQEQ